MARPKRTASPSRTAAPVAEPKKRRWVGPAVGLALLAGVVALVVFDPPPPGIEFPSMGNQHIASVSDPHVPYNSSPPSSGPHVGLLAQWGIVAEEPLPPELWVHNLEDGGIVITYDCPDGCPEFVDGLRRFAEGRVVVTPYQGIVDPDGNPHRGAAVAWTRVYYFDELTDDVVSEIETFISLYEGIDHHAG
ncbi:MAG: hypothetical protein KatS3mg011_0910 [Acidimicrobiia bacterium]|nr:MAG: hypothetical protein KatS3mg011_0910 [Acidimicrobiia bacterium]